MPDLACRCGYRTAAADDRSLFALARSHLRWAHPDVVTGSEPTWIVTPASPDTAGDELGLVVLQPVAPWGEPAST